MAVILFITYQALHSYIYCTQYTHNDQYRNAQNDITHEHTHQSWDALYGLTDSAIASEAPNQPFYCHSDTVSGSSKQTFCNDYSDFPYVPEHPNPQCMYDSTNTQENNLSTLVTDNGSIYTDSSLFTTAQWGTEHEYGHSHLEHASNLTDLEPITKNIPVGSYNHSNFAGDIHCGNNLSGLQNTTPTLATNINYDMYFLPDNSTACYGINTSYSPAVGNVNTGDFLGTNNHSLANPLVNAIGSATAGSKQNESIKPCAIQVAACDDGLNCSDKQFSSNSQIEHSPTRIQQRSKREHDQLNTKTIGPAAISSFASGPKKQKLNDGIHVFRCDQPIEEASLDSETNATMSIQECPITVDKTSDTSNCTKAESYNISGQDLQKYTIKLFGRQIFDFEKFHSFYEQSTYRFHNGNFMEQRTYIDMTAGKIHTSKFREIMQMVLRPQFTTSGKRIKSLFESMSDPANPGVKIVCYRKRYKDQSLYKIKKSINACAETLKDTFHDVKPRCDKCKNQLQNSANYTQKCIIFADFLINMFFCQHGNSSNFTLKPEWWKLNLIMTEVHIYHLWRLKEIDAAIINPTSYECDFDDEVDHIDNLLTQFSHLVINIRADLNSEYTESAVYKYRCFIMKFLTAHYHETPQYYFYHHAIKQISTSVDNNILCHDSNVLFILAFAKKAIAFDNIATAITSQISQPGETQNDHCIVKKLCLYKFAKIEMIEILHSLIIFFQKIQGLDQRANINPAVLIPFISGAVLIQADETANEIHLSCLRNDNLINYFFAKIVDLFIQ